MLIPGAWGDCDCCWGLDGARWTTRRRAGKAGCWRARPGLRVLTDGKPFGGGRARGRAGSRLAVASRARLSVSVLGRTQRLLGRRLAARGGPRRVDDWTGEGGGAWWRGGSSSRRAAISEDDANPWHGLTSLRRRSQREGGGSLQVDRLTSRLPRPSASPRLERGDGQGLEALRTSDKEH